MDSLGDRIKRYERVTNNIATPRTPLMVRVDGRSFHTLTRKAVKPFDQDLIKAMVCSAREVAEDMQGFKAAYIQSDEATFVMTDYDDLATQGWFNYELNKVISLSAAIMSVAFNKYYKTDRSPVFDSRAFSIPREEVVNAFLWRAKDWERNSLQMYCRAHFSHGKLNGKKRADMHEMLYKIGKNWTRDLKSFERNGTFLIKTEEGIVEFNDIQPTYDSIKEAIGELI